MSWSGLFSSIQLPPRFPPYEVQPDTVISQSGSEMTIVGVAQVKPVHIVASVTGGTAQRGSGSNFLGNGLVTVLSVVVVAVVKVVTVVGPGSVVVVTG